MDDPSFMGGFESLGHLSRKGKRLIEGDGAPGQTLGQS